MDHDFSLMCELDGIADKVDQYLPQAARVTAQIRAEIGIDQAGHLETFILGAFCEGIGHIFNRIAKAEVDRVQARVCLPQSWRNPGYR